MTNGLDGTQGLRDKLTVTAVTLFICAMVAIIAGAVFITLYVREQGAEITATQTKLYNATERNHALGVENHALQVNNQRTNKELGVVDGIIIAYVGDVNSSLLSVCSHVGASCTIHFQPTQEEIEKGLAPLRSGEGTGATTTTPTTTTTTIPTTTTTTIPPLTSPQQPTP
jgi:hypothetical protein